jgi:hypothetical protein
MWLVVAPASQPAFPAGPARAVTQRHVGKIVEENLFYGQIGLLRQIGVVE